MGPCTDCPKAELRLAITTTIETPPAASPPGARERVRKMAAIAAPRWKKYVNTFLAGELSGLTKYYDRLIQWLPRADDNGALLAAMDAPVKETIGRDESFTDLTGESG